VIRAAGPIGLAATILLASCSNAPADREAPDKVFNLSPSNAAAEQGCGGRNSAAPVRACARLGPTHRYKGLEFRTFEGSDFTNGALPNVPFDDANREGSAVLVVDEKTANTGAIPAFRRPPVPVDTILIAFDGRPVLDRSSDPAHFGAPPMLVVDRVIAARRVPAAQVKRRDRDGSVTTGF
jgi:hypothetical protein